MGDKHQRWKRSFFQWKKICFLATPKNYACFNIKNRKIIRILLICISVVYLIFFYSVRVWLSWNPFCTPGLEEWLLSETYRFVEREKEFMCIEFEWATHNRRFGKFPTRIKKKKTLCRKSYTLSLDLTNKRKLSPNAKIPNTKKNSICSLVPNIYKQKKQPNIIYKFNRCYNFI